MRMSQPISELFDYPVDDILAVMPPESDPLWDRSRGRQQNFMAHRSTRSITFLWTSNCDLPSIEMLDVPPALKAAAFRCGNQIAAHYSGKLVRLLLAAMPAGEEIPPHCDSGPVLERTHRCHVPIVTNADVTFEIDKIPHKLAVGRAYELDNMRLHAVRNAGSTWRVHLLCNVLPPATRVV